jgi:DNA polymerase-1
MELRLQAHYTIKVAGGDYNLCNAFMPFKHKSMYTGEEFVYGKHDYQSGEWVNEQGDLWQPTDPHTETTLKAFPWITKDHPEFKHYRSLGKRANFLKNYGGGYGAIMTQLDLPEEIAKDLDQAYYKAFPQVLDYQRWTNRQLTKYGYTENLFGRRYYFQSASNFYKDFNYMIQGGCADLMKRKEILIHKYLRENSLKSKLVLVVHDEAQVIVYDDEPFVVEAIKAIMNDNPEIDTLPMTAGIEVTMTNWAEKEEIE